MSATETTTETSVETRHMPMYKVMMHNDDKTTMEFVTGVLMSIFVKEYEEALEIMLEIHKNGVGLAGIFALEHAELKVQQAKSLARAQKYPLTCTIEEA